MDLISRGWLMRFTATLAVLYAGCVAAPRYLGDIPQFPAVTVAGAVGAAASLLIVLN